MIGVMHFTKCSPASTMASGRIATFIEKQLKDLGMEVELIHDEKSAYHSSDKHELMFVVNSPFGFCDWRREAIELVGNSDGIIWVQNDYAIKPPSQFKKNSIQIDETWTTCTDTLEKGNARYIDWNKLTYNERVAEMKTDASHVIPGLLYFGAFRQGRISSFEKYLNTVKYQTRVSTSPKNRDKFMAMNTHRTIKYYEPFSNILQLQRFQTSIYIEDDGSHGKNHSLANRFYEMLSAGLAICIDESASGIFKAYDLPKWEDFVVDSDWNVREVVKQHHKEWSKKQGKLWKRDYISELSESLILALEEVL